MALEIITAILPSILNYSVVPLKRHIGYVLKYRSNVDELKRQVEKLTDKREELQHFVDEATRIKGEEIQKNVLKWMAKSDEAIKEGRELILGGEEAKERRYFVGLCPNLKAHYLVGKKAKKECQAIAALAKEGKFNRDNISFRTRAKPIVFSPFNGSEGFPSRAAILKDIMNALTDPNVNMIGVYGMGGTGKTTLVKEIHRQAIEQKLFDVVVLATVSEKPDLRKIQGKIADVLGLKLDEETVDGRANRLCQMLMKENNVLIILDNLWEKLELESVGIPHANDQKGCKLLLTSRNRDVLSSKMGTQCDFRLEVLPEYESWSLFEMMIGGVRDPKLQPTAIEVAKKCAGLPLLLVTVASALKYKELEAWKDALNRLSTIDDEEMQSKVYSALQLSYDHLVGEELKSFFLLCGLFGFSNIDIEYLLKYSMGLGLFKHINSFEDARNRVHRLIGDLEASCLLLDSESNCTVKIHDVVRDFAVSIASRSQHTFMFYDQMKQWPSKDIPKNCIRISSYKFDVHELPEQLEFPELEFLCLAPKDRSLKIPDLFFKGLTKLKVLDLTGMCVSSPPSSLGFLSNLHALCLCACELHDITVIGQLKQMEILSFAYSDIVEMPEEVGQLTRLKSLDLSNCTKLEVIPANVISRLSLLEELHVRNSFVRWGSKRLDNDQCNASLSELENLSHLTNLEIHITDDKKLTKELFSKGLERYRIFIGDDWDWDDDYQTSRTLKLKLNENIHRHHGVKLLLKETEELQLDEVKGIKNVLYDMDREGFQQLKYLQVQNGPEIQYIFDSERWVPCNAFPILESLFLHNLMNLEKIFHGRLVAESFGKLKRLTVRHCSALKHLFPFHMIRRLSQLCEFEVVDCNKMEEIFTVEDEGRDGKNEVAEFTQLQSLKLQLPQLKSLCSRIEVPSIPQTLQNLFTVAFGSPSSLFNGTIVFPNLEKVELFSISVEKIWLNQLVNQSPSLPKLKTVIVNNCRNLKYVFTLSMAEGLINLRTLEIHNCNSMEEILGAEGETMSNIRFPNLEILKLSSLPKLIRFCSGNLVECSSLKVLRINSCPQLNEFVSSSSSEDVAVNNNPEYMHRVMFDAKVSFPNLRELQIFNMDWIKKIWHDQLQENSFCDLRVLKLRHCKQLVKVFPSDMLKRFQNLETLYIDGCDSLKEVFDHHMLKDAKMKRAEMCSQLRDLYLWHLPNLKQVWKINSQEILSFQKLQSVNIWDCPSLKSVFPPSIAQCLWQLEKLYIESCGVEAIVEKEAGEEEAAARFVFPKVSFVGLWKLPELKTFYPGIHTTEWPVLKTINVLFCDKMKVFSFESQSFQGPFQEDQPEIQIQQPLFSFQEVVSSLEQLPLDSEDTKLIRKGWFPSHLFEKLKAVDLISFHEESADLPLDVLYGFPKMEKLAVVNSKFKELFPQGELLGREKYKSCLSQIRHLKLNFLPDLKHIWNQDSLAEQALPSLEVLEVWGCDNLKNVAPSSASFQNLSTLDVWDCLGLVNVVASSTARSLVQLTSMRIRECNAVTDVVVANEGGETEDDIIFRRLERLELDGLPSLRSFCSARQKLKFPFLTEVILSGCPKMEFFTGGVLSTPNLQRVKLHKEDERGRWNSNLNATIQHLFAETGCDV